MKPGTLVQPRALIQRADGGWVAYRRPRHVLAATTPARVAAVIGQAERRARRDALHAVGFVSYEAASGLDPKLTSHVPGYLPPAWFALFEEAAPAPPPATTATRLDWQPTLDRDRYADGVERIRQHIAAGDTYQVNFSYRLRAALTDRCHGLAAALLASMTAGQSHGCGALLETADWAVVSASPELFFERRGRRLTSRPMKGTAARAADPAADEEAGRRLQASVKNRAENLMITDMVRNDLGRLATVGSIVTQDLFRLERYPTVWQLTSTVHGDSGAPLADVFRALFPAASITGAPKRRTMEIIRDLEALPREIYTGSIGVIEPNGHARFNVAIRTALLDWRRGLAEYGVGGGILWGSDAAEEHAETLAKARVLGGTGAADFELLETLLWEPEAGYQLLDRHVERVLAAARRFRRPLAAAVVEERLHATAAALPVRPHRVRLRVGACGAVDVDTAPLVPLPVPYRVALAGAPAPVLDNPFVRHKTTRRDVYDDARRAALARHPGAADVLLTNARGELTESTIANLVVDLDGTWVTPPLSAGLLPGIYRGYLLDRGAIEERTLYPADLRRARAVYLVNSVRRLWRVEMAD